MADTDEITVTRKFIQNVFKVIGGNNGGPSRLGALGCFFLSKLVGLELELLICKFKRRWLVVCSTDEDMQP